MDRRVVNFKYKDRARATATEAIAHSTQVRLVNELYMATDAASASADAHRRLLSELKRKRSGYRAQDVRRELYDAERFISLETILEKLVASKLKCAYCAEKVEVLYTQVRAPTQWSLDRIDNDQGHNGENIVISCLRCNLHRRRTDYDKFKFTKELKLVKAI